MSSATATACSADSTTPLKPGITLTPAASAMRFDSTLSPMASIAAAGGPTKVMPASTQRRAKAAFSERKP